MLIEGKTAVITGCNRGIGKSMMNIFAKNGANIWACIRKPNDNFTKYVLDLSKETGVIINPVYFDFSEINQVKIGAKTILAKKGAIDILINNAGVIFTSLFQMTTIDKMQEIFSINYFHQIFFYTTFS